MGRSVQLLIASRSSRLSRWAQSVQGRLKKPLYEIKRFSRLLGNQKIDRDRLAEYRLRLFGSRIKQDTPIAVDFSSLEWPCARCVEDLFSHTSRSFVSMNKTVIDFVAQLADLLNGKGIWLFDRGFDSRILIHAFLELGIRFAIRINASRNIWPEPFQKAGMQKKEKILLEKLLKTVAYPFSMTIPIHKRPTGIRFGFSPITLPGIESPLWVLYTSGTHDPLILLTNQPVSSEKEAQRMIRMYASRWSVEESFRDFNEEFDFQHIMVRTLRRINLLAELALWAYSFAATFFERGKRILKELIRLGGRLGIKKKTEETFGRILKRLQYLFTHAAQAP